MYAVSITRKTKSSFCKDGNLTLHHSKKLSATSAVYDI